MKKQKNNHKLDLQAIAKATGGVLVTATKDAPVSDVHEDWLNEAGFSDTQEWKRVDSSKSFVAFWPKFENLTLNFFTNDSNELCWFVRLFGTEANLFGRKPAKILDKSHGNELKRIAKTVAALDIQMLRVMNLYNHK